MEQADRLSPRERYYVEGWYYAVRVRILGAVVSGPLRNCSSFDRFAVLGDGVIELPLAKEVVPAVVVVERG